MQSIIKIFSFCEVWIIFVVFVPMKQTRPCIDELKYFLSVTNTDRKHNYQIRWTNSLIGWNWEILEDNKLLLFVVCRIWNFAMSNHHLVKCHYFNVFTLSRLCIPPNKEIAFWKIRKLQSLGVDKNWVFQENEFQKNIISQGCKIRKQLSNESVWESIFTQSKRSEIVNGKEFKT